MILENKTVIITGGDKGVGLCIAQYFYAAGAHIYLFGRNADRLVAACAELDKEQKERVKSVICDVGSYTSVKEAFERLGADDVSADILVNCSGITVNAHAQDNEYSTYSKVIDVNMVGSYLNTIHCLEMFKEKGAGKIINIGSKSDSQQDNNLCSYIATIGSAQMLTNAITKQWSCYNVLANAIVDDVFSHTQQSFLVNNPSFLQFMQEHQLKDTKDDRIATIALFLASDHCDLLTGQIINCNF